jgi:hypothetical protein
MDGAIDFVHGYAWDTSQPPAGIFHLAMTAAAYRKDYAAVKQFMQSAKFGKMPEADIGEVVLGQLTSGGLELMLGLHWNIDQDYQFWIEALSNESWPIPKPRKDHLLTSYATLEASYKGELNSEPPAWTWLDKWDRALRVDPIAQVLAAAGPQGGNETPARKRAKKLLAANSKELADGGCVDAFLKAWRRTHGIRELYTIHSCDQVKAARERRLRLATDVLTLVLTDSTRAVFDAVGLWPSLQYVTFIEAWWTYLEHMVQRTSLPIDEIHYEINSTIGVALVEALSGAGVPACGRPDYLKTDRGPRQDGSKRPPPPNISTLPVWGALTTDSFWAALWTECVQGSKWPFILRHGMQRVHAALEEKPSEQPPVRVDYAMNAGELRLTWPRYPETTRLPKLSHAIYDKAGVNWRAYFHGRHTAQLRLFVAASIAELAVTELGLPPRVIKTVTDESNKRGRQTKLIDIDRSDGDDLPIAVLSEETPLLESTAPDVLLKEELEDADVESLNADRKRYLAAVAARPSPFGEEAWEPLKIVAGSFPWGGRKPPHVTHRDGMTFDVQMGADCQPWPTIEEGVSKFLPAAVAINWPAVLQALERSGWADRLRVSVKTYPPGSGKAVWRATTLREHRTAYDDAVSKYELLRRELPEAPDLPLPLSVTSRRQLSRYAIQRFKAGKKAEARSIHELVAQTSLGEALASRATRDPLVLRHDSRENATFKGENTSLIFRSLVADLVVAPEWGKIKRIVSHTLLPHVERLGGDIKGLRAALLGTEQSSIDPVQAWADIETRWQDLPLPHTRAGIQRGLVATIALLLSGMRTLIYGSTLTFARAVRVLTDAAVDPVIASAIFRTLGWLTKTDKGADVFEMTELQFMPHNHYHHHHVQYAVRGYDVMYQRGSKDWGLEAEIAALARSREAWLDLAIDLEPFLTYIEAEQDSPGVPPQVANERDLVVAFLEDYIAEYNSRFRLGADEDPLNVENARGYSRFAAARGRLLGLLLKANDGDLLTPKAQQPRGDEVVGLSEASKQMFRVIKPALDFRAMKAYLDKAKKAGLSLEFGSLELWDDSTLAEVAKALEGPEKLRAQLNKVLNFTVEDIDDPADRPAFSDPAAHYTETDFGTEIQEEEEFRRGVYQELIELIPPEE